MQGTLGRPLNSQTALRDNPLRRAFLHSWNTGWRSHGRQPAGVLRRDMASLAAGCAGEGGTVRSGMRSPATRTALATIRCGRLQSRETKQRQRLNQKKDRQRTRKQTS